jgi:hypothetical protein
LPENGTGWTRTLPVAHGPVWFDYGSACWVGDGGPGIGAVRANFDREYHPSADDEAAANELEACGSVQFRGSQYYNEQHEREKAEKAEIDMWRRCGR